jgi:hypothetical protein
MAKIYYSLYDRMLYEKGLLQAFAVVKSNKGLPGVDGQTIEDLAEHSSEEVALRVDIHLLRKFEGRIDRSRIRGPYVRFCERAGANLIRSPHPTRLMKVAVVSAHGSRRFPVEKDPPDCRR